MIAKRVAGLYYSGKRTREWLKFKAVYGQEVVIVLEPTYPGILAFIGRGAMENIANSDAPYHNAEHTMMVTLVGQEILRGKHIREGGVTPRDWLHFISSLLCHDIGYVRGVCLCDRNGRYVCNEQGDLVDVPDGATDAAMAPYHVSNRKCSCVSDLDGRGSCISIPW